jgi:hypothetical protein
VSELGLRFSADDWPYGLRCLDCDRTFSEGDRYSTRLIGLVQCPDPDAETAGLTEVACLGCALA